jgi:hypothetical protein
MMLGIAILALVVFFMYMWKTPQVQTQGCSTCPNRKNIVD